MGERSVPPTVACIARDPTQSSNRSKTTPVAEYAVEVTGLGESSSQRGPESGGQHLTEIDSHDPLRCSKARFFDMRIFIAPNFSCRRR